MQASKQNFRKNGKPACIFCSIARNRFIANSPTDNNFLLQQEMKELKACIEEVFADPNDINEDTRIQLELINQALAGLQVRNKEQEKKQRPRIGFIKSE